MSRKSIMLYLLWMKDAICRISKQRTLQPSSRQPVQPAPVVHHQGGEKQDTGSGYWPSLGKVHLREMISSSPEPCIFSYLEKCYIYSL